MFEGLLLGACFGSLVGVVIGIITNDLFDNFLIGCLLTVIVGAIIGIFIGIKVDKVEYDKKIANWRNTELVIESSMKDESLNQLEKANLVKTIVEYNMQLTELKEDAKQWWYFYLDDSKVNELDIITIE